MKRYAVIVAGGAGSRMGAPTPKQFLLLKDKPVLYYTLEVFLEAFADTEIILVLPASYTGVGQEIIDRYFAGKHIHVTTGGSTRFESVKNGLAEVKEESIVFVHDGVRCLLSAGLIQRCYKQAVDDGSAIPVVASRDSVRLISTAGNAPLDRSNVMLVQTPQTFRSEIILPAFSVTYNDSFTDEATVVEAYGSKVSLIEGEENNIKITRPADLIVAEWILGERK